ncbi:MAG: response regulator transcription factor [Terracidiphilus sp.]
MNRARVLIADDHGPLREATARMLASSFDVVGTAQDGQDLISKAEVLNPDVIISDITMPILGGIEAARLLRKSRSAARIVFLTIHDENEFIRACLDEGALGYVIKAHMKDDLVLAINAAMKGKRFISPSLSMSKDRP